MSKALMELLRELKQRLGLKTSSIKAQGVLDLSTFSWIFQHTVFPEVDIEIPVSVSGFCPLFPAGLTDSSESVLSHPLDSSFSTFTNIRICLVVQSCET
jgi:hypothetical protein